MEKSVQITLIIVSAVLILGLIGITTFSGAKDTITVNGQASIKAIPDLVGVYFNVQTRGATSAEATQKNSEITDELKTNIIKLGFAENEIQTENFNVYPDYKWVNGKNIENGYIATHSIKIKLSTSETSKISEIIDAGVNSGAGISYINFELTQEKQNEYKAEAIKLAAQDARVKAESAASGFNKKLGSLVSTSVDNFNYYPWRAYDYAEGATTAQVKEATASITPSEQDISASVSAVYKIK